MLHSGGTRLDDMRTLRNDAALVSLLDIPCFPSSRAVGAWIHRMSKETSEQIRFASSISLQRDFEETQG